MSEQGAGPPQPPGGQLPPSQSPPGPGWWLASDGRWYPPSDQPAQSNPYAAPGPAPYGGYSAQPYGYGYGYGRGPIGEVRSWGLVFLLGLVTCGIYHLYWLFKMHDEVKQYSGQGVGGGLGLVLAILCSVINYFLLPSEIEKMYQQDGQASPVTATLGFWVLLPLVGPLIWLSKVQHAANQFWRARGAVG